MLFPTLDVGQDEEAWSQSEVGAFIYVPRSWRTGQRQITTSIGPLAEIEDALKELHASYHDLPVPDRLLDLVGRA